MVKELFIDYNSHLPGARHWSHRVLTFVLMIESPGEETPAGQRRRERLRHHSVDRERPPADKQKLDRRQNVGC